LLHKIQKDF